MNRFTRRAPTCSTLAIVTCLTLLAGAALPARAETPPPEVSVSLRVSLTGLDLDTRAGQQQAQLRLSNAASRLCHQFVDSRHFGAQQLMFDCVRDALAPALAELERATRARTVALAAETDSAAAIR